MAAFTSVQSGNWNDGATWGNTSPGAKGTDWPGNAGDTATIANTHVVVYNVSEANQLGAVTINAGGELTAAINQNTVLTLGNVSLTVNGKLSLGTLANPVNKSYSCLINHYSASRSNRLLGGSSSEIILAGDPDYFGSTIKATLAAAFTTGQTFTVAGNLIGKWTVGQMLLLIKDGEYSSQATDLALVTIASLSANGDNTDIIINEAFPGGTYSIGSDVFHLSRNVRYCCNGADTAPALNTSDSSAGSWGSSKYIPITVSAASIGWMNSYESYLSYYYYSVIHNSYSDCNIINGIMENAIFIANNANTKIGRIIGSDVTELGCDSGVYFPNSSIDKVRIINDASVVDGHSSENAVLTNVEIYKCHPGYYGAVTPFGGIISGYFGQNANGLSYWVDDLIFGIYSAERYEECIIKNLICPAASISDYLNMFGGIYANTPFHARQGYFIEAFNGSRSDPRFYKNMGYGIMVTADGSGIEPSQRSGGNSKVWKISTFSNCDQLRNMMKTPVLCKYFIDTIPQSKTFRIYLQSDYAGTFTGIIRLIFNGGTKYVTFSVPARSSQTDWSNHVEITETIDEIGYVYIDFWVYGYESGKFIWVDPVLEIS